MSSANGASINSSLYIRVPGPGANSQGQGQAQWSSATDPGNQTTTSTSRQNHGITGFASIPQKPQLSISTQGPAVQYNSQEQQRMHNQQQQRQQQTQASSTMPPTAHIPVQQAPTRPNEFGMHPPPAPRSASGPSRIPLGGSGIPPESQAPHHFGMSRNIQQPLPDRQMHPGQQQNASAAPIPAGHDQQHPPYPQRSAPMHQHQIPGPRLNFSYDKETPYRPPPGIPVQHHAQPQLHPHPAAQQFFGSGMLQATQERSVDLTTLTSSPNLEGPSSSPSSSSNSFHQTQPQAHYAQTQNQSTSRPTSSSGAPSSRSRHQSMDGGITSTSEACPPGCTCGVVYSGRADQSMPPPILPLQAPREPIQHSSGATAPPSSTQPVPGWFSQQRANPQFQPPPPPPHHNHHHHHHLQHQLNQLQQQQQQQNLPSSLSTSNHRPAQAHLPQSQSHPQQGSPHDSRVASGPPFVNQSTIPHDRRAVSATFPSSSRPQASPSLGSNAPGPDHRGRANSTSSGLLAPHLQQQQSSVPAPTQQAPQRLGTNANHLNTTSTTPSGLPSTPSTNSQSQIEQAPPPAPTQQSSTTTAPNPTLASSSATSPPHPAYDPEKAAQIVHEAMLAALMPIQGGVEQLWALTVTQFRNVLERMNGGFVSALQLEHERAQAIEAGAQEAQYKLQEQVGQEREKFKEILEGVKKHFERERVEKSRLEKELGDHKLALRLAADAAGAAQRERARAQQEKGSVEVKLAAVISVLPALSGAGQGVQVDVEKVLNEAVNEKVEERVRAALLEAAEQRAARENAEAKLTDVMGKLQASLQLAGCNVTPIPRRSTGPPSRETSTVVGTPPPKHSEVVHPSSNSRSRRPSESNDMALAPIPTEPIIGSPLREALPADAIQLALAQGSALAGSSVSPISASAALPETAVATADSTAPPGSTQLTATAHVPDSPMLLTSVTPIGRRQSQSPMAHLPTPPASANLPRPSVGQVGPPGSGKVHIRTPGAQTLTSASVDVPAPAPSNIAGNGLARSRAGPLTEDVHARSTGNGNFNGSLNESGSERRTGVNGDAGAGETSEVGMKRSRAVYLGLDAARPEEGEPAPVRRLSEDQGTARSVSVTMEAAGPGTTHVPVDNRGQLEKGVDRGGEEQRGAADASSPPPDLELEDEPSEGVPRSSSPPADDETRMSDIPTSDVEEGEEDEMQCEMNLEMELQDALVKVEEDEDMLMSSDDEREEGEVEEVGEVAERLAIGGEGERATSVTVPPPGGTGRNTPPSSASNAPSAPSSTPVPQPETQRPRQPTSSSVPGPSHSSRLQTSATHASSSTAPVSGPPQLNPSVAPTSVPSHPASVSLPQPGPAVDQSIPVDVQMPPATSTSTSMAPVYSSVASRSTVPRPGTSRAPGPLGGQPCAPPRPAQPPPLALSDSNPGPGRTEAVSRLNPAQWSGNSIRQGGQKPRQEASPASPATLSPAQWPSTAYRPSQPPAPGNNQSSPAAVPRLNPAQWSPAPRSAQPPAPINVSVPRQQQTTSPATLSPAQWGATSRLGQQPASVSNPSVRNGPGGPSTLSPAQWTPMSRSNESIPVDDPGRFYRRSDDYINAPSHGPVATRPPPAQPPAVSKPWATAPPPKQPPVKAEPLNLAPPEPSPPARLGIKHWPLLYVDSGARWRCRLCMTMPKDSKMPRAVFDKKTAHDVLFKHAQEDHPVACAEMLKLSPTKLNEMKARLPQS